MGLCSSQLGFWLLHFPLNRKEKPVFSYGQDIFLEKAILLDYTISASELAEYSNSRQNILLDSTSQCSINRYLGSLSIFYLRVVAFCTLLIAYQSAFYSKHISGPSISCFQNPARPNTHQSRTLSTSHQLLTETLLGLHAVFGARCWGWKRFIKLLKVKILNWIELGGRKLGLRC